MSIWNSLLDIWNWLQDSNNRDVLTFIGAGIVGLAGLLKMVGVIGKKKPPAPDPQPAPSNTQTVTAHAGGTAVGIQGQGNTVNLPADKH